MMIVSLFGCSLLDYEASPTPPTGTPTSDVVFEGMAGRLIRVVYFPPPEFMGSVVVYTGRYPFPEEMCVRSNGHYLWEPSDTAQSMSRHYTSRDNFALSLDDVDSLPSDAIKLEDTLDEYLETRGDEIISYGNLWYCFNTTHLEVGLHMAGISLVSPSGKTYTHSWEFEITNG
jgi:hypothetical protein